MGSLAEGVDVEDVGDTTRLGTEWRGGLITLRLKQLNHTMYSRNQTHSRVCNIAHTSTFGRTLIYKKKERNCRNGFLSTWCAHHRRDSAM